MMTTHDPIIMPMEDEALYIGSYDHALGSTQMFKVGEAMVMYFGTIDWLARRTRWMSLQGHRKVM